MDKLTITRKNISQIPIFGLWKWRDSDHETPITMQIDGSTTNLFIEKDRLSGRSEPLSHPGYARLEIMFQPVPAGLIKGLESKGKPSYEVAQQIYSIYVKAMQRFDTLLRTAGGVTALLGMSPMTIRDFFGLGGLASERVTWRINDSQERGFVPKIPKGKRTRNVLFKGRQLVTPAAWGRIQAAAPVSETLPTEIVELHRIKGKALWGERKVPAIEASILMETILRDYGLKVLIANGLSSTQTKRLRDELTFSTLLNILFPLSLKKSERARISAHLGAVDALRRLRNDLVHGNISEKDVDPKQVIVGIDGALGLIAFLHKKVTVGRAGKTA